MGNVDGGLPCQSQIEFDVLRITVLAFLSVEEGLTLQVLTQLLLECVVKANAFQKYRPIDHTSRYITLIDEPPVSLIK